MPILISSIVLLVHVLPGSDKHLPLCENMGLGSRLPLRISYMISYLLRVAVRDSESHLNQQLISVSFSVLSLHSQRLQAHTHSLRAAACS